MKVTLKDITKGPGYVEMYKVKVNGEDVARLSNLNGTWYLEKSGMTLVKSLYKERISEYIHANEEIFEGYAVRNAKERQAFEIEHNRMQEIIAKARA